MGRAVGRIHKAVTMAVLLALTVLLPAFAMGAGSREHASRDSHALCSTTIDGTHSSDLANTLPFQASQAPDDSEDAPSFGLGPEQEEEVRALHLPVDLSRLAHRHWLPDERVDHAYEGWFYSVTHPPLTPPPNAR